MFYSLTDVAYGPYAPLPYSLRHWSLQGRVCVSQQCQRVL
jgi:hypothetical protein